MKTRDLKNIRWLRPALVVVGLLLASIPIDRVGMAQATQISGADAPSLQPGKIFTIHFPGLPPIFAEQWAKQNHKGATKGPENRGDTGNAGAAPDRDHPPQMTVFLPRNYDAHDAARRYPLLIFLSGGDGGRAGDPSVARKLSEETDFVCVNLPLFKTDLTELLLRENDSRYAWPFYKTMLDKLEATVPNLDRAQYVLGGFSNGAHMTQGLIDTSDGEVARRFSAFFLVEGGGRLSRWDLLKGKPLLMLYGTGGGRDGDRFRTRAGQWRDMALTAGVKAATHEMSGTGHAFPESAYPAVRSWLRLAVQASSSAQAVPAPAPAEPTLKVARNPAATPYYLSLPAGWTPRRDWPILVTIDGSGHNFEKNFQGFVRARGDKPFLIVTPCVSSNGNDPADAQAVLAIVREVQQEEHGQARFFLTGFSAGGHLLWQIVFAHPELLAGAVPAAGNFLGRGVTGFSTAPERIHLPLHAFQGEKDPYLAPLSSQWANAEKVTAEHGYQNVSHTMVPGAGHQPFAPQTLAFCASLLPPEPAR